MALNQALAFSGLQGSANLSSRGVSGIATIGSGLTQVQLTSATEAVTFEVELDSTYTVEINPSTWSVTPAGAGSAQVETATAAGTITGDGNASVTITSPLVTGSPLTVPVAVLNTDTAATWAGKVRTALGGVTAITDHYTVGGSSATITLTALVVATNDTTLNIALDNGTCTGITAAPTSANTTTGKVPAKCTRLTGATWGGENFEGGDVAPVGGAFYGIEIAHQAGGEMLYSCNIESIQVIPSGGVYHSHSATGLTRPSVSDTLIFTGKSVYSKALVTLVFSTT